MQVGTPADCHSQVGSPATEPLLIHLRIFTGTLHNSLAMRYLGTLVQLQHEALTHFYDFVS